MPASDLVTTNATGRVVQFSRGYAGDPSHSSFVVPLNSQRGISLDQNINGIYPGTLVAAWLAQGYYHVGYGYYYYWGSNPLAGFGSRVGGSPLYVNQSASFAVHVGDRGDRDDSTQGTIRIHVYQKPAFTSVGAIEISIPRFGTPEWDAMLTANGEKTVTQYGLKTVVRRIPGAGWGSPHSAYLLTHTAERTDYAYEVTAMGFVDNSAKTARIPVAATDYQATTATWSRLYVVEFEERPPWRATFLDQPHFEGKPLPPTYQGKSLEELLAVQAAMPALPSLTASDYLRLDHSPELRRHPILDRFVADMGNDPIALVNYVLNEIRLADFFEYNESGSVAEASINLGGINRSALGAFLEGQGSPTEQCALLVYLLRQVGVPAVYVSAPHNGLKMLDSRLDTLLRMHIKGAVNWSGTSANVPHLVPVNYPWVAAYIASENRWVHIFPWLKDTELVEGLELYGQMPEEYNRGIKWAKRYLEGDSGILSLGAESDQPLDLFPRFIEKKLKENHPEVSIGNIGMRVFDRKQLVSRWDDFPKPFAVEGTLSPLESCGSLTNAFDTIQIEVYSKNNPARRIDTGEMRIADIHNRQVLLRHEKTGVNLHNMILTLEAQRPGTSSTAAFGTGADPILKHQGVAALDSGDDGINFKITQKRHRNLVPGSDGYTVTDEYGRSTTYPGNFWNAFGRYSAPTVTTCERSVRKGDLAAFALNVGQVSRRMLDVHAEQYWRFERSMKSDPNQALDVEKYHGIPAYLMGMSYWERMARFDELNVRLHKINRVSNYGCGLALIHPRRVNGLLPNNGEIQLDQPGVDIFDWGERILFNGTIHPDMGIDSLNAPHDYFSIKSAQGSAAEHEVINSFFGQTAAVSTVKLLHLAGGANLVRLNKDNYAAQGEVYYGSQRLKDHDPAMWGNVVALFSPSNSWNDTANYGEAWLTPGPVTSGSYRGMGAWVQVPSGGAGGLISNNLNGGWGMTLETPLTFSYSDFWTLLSGPSGYRFMNLGQASPRTLAPSVFQPNQWDVIDVGLGINLRLDGFMGGSWLNGTTAFFGLSAGATPNDTFRNVISYVQNQGIISQIANFFSNARDWVFDPVSVVTGEFYINAVDLTLASPMPLEIRRNYSSANLVDGPFGYGWKSAAMHYLSITQNGALVYAAEMDGSVIAYRQHPTTPNLWTPTPEDNPHLTNHTTAGIGSAANLLNSRIERPEGGNTYKLYGSDGGIRTFTVRSYPVAEFTRERPYLDEWRDHRGNSLVFEYGNDPFQTDYGLPRRVRASNGNFLGYYYDVYGHIQEAYTGDGRRLYYHYDKHGDLIRVVLPDASEITFEYEHKTQTVDGRDEMYSTHLILREVKPDGRVLENDYDADRRVVQQRATVGEGLVPVRNASFEYRVASSQNGLTTGYTLVKDAYDRVTRYDYSANLITRATDPLNQVEEQEWYLPGDSTPGAYPRSLKRTVSKRGLVTELKYDSRGNAVEMKATGNLTGGGASETAVSIFEYNNHNLPTRAVDAVGNSTVRLYENPSFPRLPTAVEKRTPSALISSTRLEYHSVTEGPITSRGLLLRETRAVNTPDEAQTEWTHDGRGFVTRQVRHTGTGDPDVGLDFFYNNRGELVEQRDGAGRVTRYAYDARGNRIWTEVKDAGGTLVAWHYDYFNRNGEIEWSDGARYNPEDYVWRKYDGAGRPKEEIRWRSQAQANGSGVEVPAGDDLYSVTRYKHDLFGNLIEVADPRQNTLRMEYDAIGQLTAKKSYEGAAGGVLLATERLEYEPGGAVSVYTSPINGVTRKFYTSTGKLRRQENPDGSVLEWRYDLAGRVVKETLSNGSFRETAYDEGARAVTRTLKSGTGAVLASEIKTMDRRGNLVSETGPEGHVFARTYDGLDRIKTSSGPGPTTPSARQTVTHIYDASGIVERVSNGTGDLTLTTRDALGRPVSVEIRDVNGATVRRTAYAYSPDHHSVTATSGSGPQAISTTTYTDNAGNRVLTRHASGDFVRNTCDVAGNLLSTRNEKGLVTTFQYDALNRLQQTVLPDGAATTFQYDAAGNLLERAMPRGLTWTAAYDPAGRMTGEQLHGGTSTTRQQAYEYYASGPSVGRLQRTTDPRGVIHDFAYDDLLRLASRTTAGSQPEHALTVAYEYDRRGLVTSLSQTYANATVGAATAIQRAYDGYGQVVDERVLVNGSIQRHLTQEWDGAGRRSRLAAGSQVVAQGNGAGRNVSFGYWADGLLKGIQAASQDYQFNYSDGGLLLNRQNPFRTQTADLRDSRGRIRQLTTASGTTQPLREAMDWTADSRLQTGITTREGAEVTKETRDYTYNNRGALLSETFAGTPDQPGRTDYLYDLGQPGRLGVLTSASTSGGVSGAWSVPSGGLDDFSRVKQENWNVSKRLFRASGVSVGAASVDLSLDGVPVGQVKGNPESPDGMWRAEIGAVGGAHTLVATANHPSGQYFTSNTVSFAVAPTSASITDSYDAEGHVTGRSFADGRTQTLTWDGDGRLVKVVDRTGDGQGYDWTALYDGLGRRIRTTHTPVGGMAYAVDSWFDPQVEFLEVGVEAQGQRYWKLHGPDLNGGYGGLQGIGGLEAVVGESDGQVTGIIQDSFGHAVATVRDGKVEWNEIRLTGYGPLPGHGARPVSDTVSVIEATGWRGKRMDPTGYYYLGARYYDPQSARFLSADPLGHAASMDLYAYADADPINGCDPDGRLGKKIDNSNVGMNTKDMYNEFTNQSDYVAKFNLTTGFVFGFLSGDMFDRQDPFESDALITSINGVRNSQLEGRAMARNMENVFGGKANNVVNNSHFWGIGDFIQIIGETLSAADITSVRAAQSIRANHGGLIVAHSQGTKIAQNTFQLLSLDILVNTDFIGCGGQTNVDAYDEAVRSAINIVDPWDPVPLNQVPWPGVRQELKPPGHDGFAIDPNHNFNKTYLPYLEKTVAPRYTNLYVPSH